MYATLTLIPIKPGMRDEIERVADGLFASLRGEKGFKSITFFIDPDGNECGGFAVWDSKEDAEASWATTGPKIQENMSKIATGPPARRVLEVYEPKM